MTSAHVQSRRSRARGYTAVEVLIAMTLFAIGAAGVIGMQRVTIQGGEDARRFDMATNIANEWLSRLQRDATFWTEPNEQKPTSINIANTRWLKNIDTCTANLFCDIPMPSGVAAGLSPAFDGFGRDLPDGTTDARYCVQYRLTWIAAPGVGPTYPKLNLTGLMRAEVRVYWTKLEVNPIQDCTAPPPEAITPTSNFHFVYATTAIRENALR